MKVCECGGGGGEGGEWGRRRGGGEGGGRGVRGVRGVLVSCPGLGLCSCVVAVEGRWIGTF